MYDPVNTLAQLWLWRLEQKVAAILFAVAMFLLVAVLGVFHIDPVWAFVAGFAALVVPFLYYLGQAVMDCVDGGAGQAERAERRRQKDLKSGLIDFSPGWQQRLLDRDIENWKRTGNIKQLRAFKVPGYTD